MKRIAIGLPSRSEMSDFGTITNIMMRRDYLINMHKGICGLVGLSNNIVWTEFLNKQVTPEKTLVEDPIDYFVMIHDDVAPVTEDWLEILIEELECRDADVVSVVIPYKDESGRTSTGIASAISPWLSTRRLTLKEIWKLPETFGAEVVPEGKLLQINTGCMIVNARKPWVISGNVWFENLDRIFWQDGRYWPASVSEDEQFSRMVQEQGGKVFATRKVQVEHRGTGRFRNDAPWGKDTDEAYTQLTGEGPFKR